MVNVKVLKSKTQPTDPHCQDKPDFLYVSCRNKSCGDKSFYLQILPKPIFNSRSLRSGEGWRNRTPSLISRLSKWQKNYVFEISSASSRKSEIENSRNLGENERTSSSSDFASDRFDGFRSSTDFSFSFSFRQRVSFFAALPRTSDQGCSSKTFSCNFFELI